MSLSKELNLMSITDKMKRQSFEERFCDDLCAEILQYLPTRIKFGFECVSKQFQRTIFVRQIEINGREKRLFSRTTAHLPVREFFELIVKKCPNIRSINKMDFFPPYVSIESNNLFLQFIIKNCYNLRETDFPLQRMSCELRKQFIEKFGTKLKSLSQRDFYKEEITDLNEINCFQNIEELNIENKYIDETEYCGELKLKKLKKLRINWRKADKSVANLLSNAQNIEVLDINCDLLTDVGIHTLMPQFLTFSNLIEFKLQNPSKTLLNDPTFLFNGDSKTQTFIRQMARNCPKLKSFGIQTSLSGLSLSQILSPLKQLRELKRLDLMLDRNQLNQNEKFDRSFGHHFGKPEFNHWPMFSFKAFEGFENITHLRLQFNEYPIIDKFLEEIDIYLPNLQYLEITSFLKPFKTDSIWIILSRLERIRTIKLKFNHNYDNYYGNVKKQLINNCKKLKSVEMSTTIYRKDSFYF